MTGDRWGVHGAGSGGRTDVCRRRATTPSAASRGATAMPPRRLSPGLPFVGRWMRRRRVTRSSTVPCRRPDGAVDVLDSAGTTWCMPAMRLISTGLSIFLATTGHAETPAGPYWIVAGSFADPGSLQVQGEAVRRASAAVARCGLEPFTDFSAKFAGFGQGLDVVVVGGYASRAAARADLARLRPCVPAAYVREGRYLGE